MGAKYEHLLGVWVAFKVVFGRAVLDGVFRTRSSMLTAWRCMACRTTNLLQISSPAITA